MNFKQESLKLLLDKMLNQSRSFSICDVDSAGKLVGIDPSRHPDYRYLHALHCVNYSEMSAEMRNDLPKYVMAVLSNRTDIELMTKALKAIDNNEIKNHPDIEDIRSPLRKIK